MRDGHQGLMYSASHEIDLVADAKPFQSVRYPAGIRMHDIEKAKWTRWWSTEVAVRSLLTDWAAPVVLE